MFEFCFGRRLGLGFGGAVSLPSLGKMNFNGFDWKKGSTWQS